jgi:Zn-dependent protease with chaperone function
MFIADLRQGQGMGHDRSLAGRALIMLALFIGFYVLAIAVAMTLIAAPVLEIMFLNRLHIYVVVLAFAGLGILWSLVPRRREKWVDPGPRFSAETQPELTWLIRRVADKVGQEMPAELYLLDDLNAFVTTRGGFMGFGGRRVLAVGVPLMIVLDERQLASVLAHEFGHFHGGDTRLLPLVYRTREAMERTLSAAHGAVQSIFKAYASFYLAHTQGISRAQEFSADRLGARVASAEDAAGALARLPMASAVFDYYRNNEYAPVLAAGRQPPYLAGFEATLFSAFGTATLDAGLSADVALGSGTQSRFDSHPSPLDRVRALGVDPATVVARPLPRVPAAALLRDPVGVEAALVARHTGDFPPERATVDWEDVGEDVMLPAWRAAVAEQLLPAAPNLASAGVPISPDGLAGLGSAMCEHAGVAATRPERENMALMLCSRYLVVAAADVGWRIDSLPGEPIRLTRDGQAMDLLEDYTQVCAGRLDPERWRARVSAAGLSAATPSAIRAHPATGAGAMQQHAAAWSGTAVHDGTSAAATATAPAPAAPTALQYRGKPSLTRELVIDGYTVRWGDQVVDGREVTALGYAAGDNHWKACFSTPSGDLTFKVGQRKKQAEAWSALMRWSELYVEPRLVDHLLAQIHETGGVQIDRVLFTVDGFSSRNGHIVPWDQFAGTAFTGADVTLHRIADNFDGHAKAAAVRTHIKHGGAVVPALCQAILASRN